MIKEINEIARVTNKLCSKIGCETDGTSAYGVETIFGTVWFCSYCASVIQNVWSGHTQNK